MVTRTLPNITLYLYCSSFFFKLTGSLSKTLLSSNYTASERARVRAVHNPTLISLTKILILLCCEYLGIGSEVFFQFNVMDITELKECTLKPE